MMTPSSGKNKGNRVVNHKDPSFLQPLKASQHNTSHCENQLLLVELAEQLAVFRSEVGLADQNLCLTQHHATAAGSAVDAFLGGLTHRVHRVDAVHEVSFPHVDSNLQRENRNIWHHDVSKHGFQIT